MNEEEATKNTNNNYLQQVITTQVLWSKSIDFDNTLL